MLSLNTGVQRSFGLKSLLGDQFAAASFVIAEIRRCRLHGGDKLKPTIGLTPKEIGWCNLGRYISYHLDTSSVPKALFAELRQYLKKQVVKLAQNLIGQQSFKAANHHPSFHASSIET